MRKKSGDAILLTREASKHAQQAEQAQGTQQLRTSNSPALRSAVGQDWMPEHHSQLNQESVQSVRISNSPAQRSAVEQDWMPEYHWQLKQHSTACKACAPQRAPPSALLWSRTGCRSTTGS